MANNTGLVVALVIALGTAVVFAGLFGWQVVTNERNTDVPITTAPSPAVTTPIVNNVTYDCPLYPYTQPMDTSDINQLYTLFKWLDEYIASTVDELTRPSVSATLAYKDTVLWRGNFGTVKKGISTAPSSDTIYRIGSISKLFSSLMMFKLYDDKKLDLFDSVKKFAPTFDIGRPFGNKNEIKLIDIASQISGLPRSLPYEITNPNGALIWNGTIDEALKILEGEIVVAEPRTKCVYSNMAYPFLADILSRNFTDDGDFEKWCKENILDPLALHDTYFSFPEDKVNQMATGYTGAGDEAVQYDLLWYRPAGNYYSTCNDLNKLAMSLLEENGTLLFSHETLQTTLRPAIECQSDYFSPSTGSPWEVDFQHNRTIIRKDGDVAGYSSTLALVPDMKMTFTVLMSGTRAENVARKALNEIIPAVNSVLRKKHYPLAPTPNAQKYIGLYEIANVQYWNITADKSNVLYMTDIKQPPGRYKTLGLSFISEQVLRMTILGGAFPCYLGASNLEVQNGTPVHFYNASSSGLYQSFDMPELSVYGFKRVEQFSIKK